MEEIKLDSVNKASLPLDLPLVSVIIPCYNQAHYLAEAIESLLKQDYPAIEIVVVDDGSTDHTRALTESYTGLKPGIKVKYVYKKNGGLPAARNTGIDESSGDLLIFLDADDWLYPKALENNVNCLLQQPEAAFVSGAFDAVHVHEQVTKEYIREVRSEHYCRLLEGNYIGMVAAVLFRRSVLEEFRFNPALKSCEDYDLYLRIARKYPVHHHGAKIAAYRIHAQNMSSNLPRMLENALAALAQQQKTLQTPEEHEAYRKGRAYWKDFYGEMLYDNLVWGHLKVSKAASFTLLKHKPALFFSVFKLKSLKMIKSKIKQHTPGFLKAWLRKNGLINKQHDNGEIPVGSVSIGDFDRLKPISTCFGYDRGGPIDRYYIENFLQQEAGSIQGRVLEIGDNYYTMHYGGERVRQSDILHVDESNPQATIIGDISHAPQIADNTFDCIVLTQTLHLIYDFKEALETCHRILKPGGTLLLTVPGINSIDHGEWKDIWYWAFTDKSMKRLMPEAFPGGEIDINVFGNVLVASAFLYGLGVAEVSKEKLDHYDEHFQVIITVKAIKAK